MTADEKQKVVALLEYLAKKFNDIVKDCHRDLPHGYPVDVIINKALCNYPIISSPMGEDLKIRE